ncbi:MAG: ABC transporter ATP-binding protein [Chloroflexi bacterium]|nr:ABC transporter ATP-binding protein [Chloroflexota bacterium]
MALAVEMIGIRKEFPGVVANDNVNLSVEQGEIHALVGENGAGKTTLMNILYGLYRAEAGTIKIRGKEVHIHRNSDAITLGIGMVHQSFKLVPSFTVAENITLGAEPRKFIFTDRNAVRKNVQEISERFGLQVDPDTRIRDLPVGVQQRVEILKALYRNADILILDEPTAVLTPQETRDLFGVVRSLVAKGKTVIFITHKFREVMEISNRVTVMRDGKVVATKETRDTNPAELARMMVGREVLLRVDKEKARPQEAVLQIQNLKVLDNRNLQAVRDVSLEVHKGEILGIAGVEGNGQRELVEAIVGLRPAIKGAIQVKGKEITGLSVRDRRETGISCVPEDRYVRGVALGASIEDNLIVGNYFKEPMSKGQVLNLSKIADFARDMVKKFDVRTPGTTIPAFTLSGGNLQKVVLAREISAEPELLIVAQPTRGLDVGSIEFVHRRIVEARDKGAAVLLVSAELEEVMSLSDRISVIYEGRIVGTIDADLATEEGLGLWMAGVTDHHKPDEIPAAGDQLDIDQKEANLV